MKQQVLIFSERKLAHFLPKKATSRGNLGSGLFFYSVSTYLTHSETVA